MAGSDSQKQFLTLIRDFATEKSQGERRILNQRKRIEELRSELEAASAQLEQAKRDRETIEQELKGHEVELWMNEASIQALESRNSLTNKEISKLGSELEALKSEENSLRDSFIQKMFELNADIRKFQESLASDFNAENFSMETSHGDSSKAISLSAAAQEQDAQKAKKVLENKHAHILSQTNEVEHQYKAEQVIHEQVKQELVDLENKASLMESIMKESRELQELSEQILKLEEKYASLGDELQKKFLCPRCHQDNSEELSDILQMSAGS